MRGRFCGEFFSSCFLAGRDRVRMRGRCGCGGSGRGGGAYVQGGEARRDGSVPLISTVFLVDWGS